MNYHNTHVRASLRGDVPQMCGLPHNYALRIMNYHNTHVRASLRGDVPQMCGFPHNYALYFIPGRPQGIAPTGGFPQQLRIMNYELP